MAHTDDQHRELDRIHTEHGHAEHDGLYNEDVAHEHSDVNVRAILMFCGGLVAVAVVVHIAMWALFIVFEKQAAANDPVMSPHALPAGQLPPEPRLLTDEPLNLKQVKDQETQALDGYGWIDQQAGTARMPIEEAKKKLLHDGLPVRPDAPEDPSLGTSAPARGEASGGRLITLKPATAAEPGAVPPPAGEHKGEPAPAAPHKGGH